VLFSPSRTIVRALTGGQNGFRIMVGKLTQGVVKMAQALLRLCSGLVRLPQASSGSAQACSGSTQVGSPSAQVKAAVAPVRRLKRNQRKGKLILSLWVSHVAFNWIHISHLERWTLTSVSPGQFKVETQHQNIYRRLRTT
jgi:hypothetical protein